MARLLDKKGLKRKNAWKAVRTVLQLMLLAFIALWVIWNLKNTPRTKEPDEVVEVVQTTQADDGTVTDANGNVLKDAIGVNPVNGTAQIAVSSRSALPEGAEPAVHADEGARFICV